jgi:hypothetical protein
MPVDLRSRGRALRVAVLLPSVLLCLSPTAYGTTAGTPPQRHQRQDSIGSAVPPSRLTGSSHARRAADGAGGSIVYVRGADVYVMRPDGSDPRRLTRNGTADDPWSSPSEDDAGNVVAVHGMGDTAELVRMDQSGRILTSIDPPVRSLATGFARVSPDGDRIAYGSMFGYTDCSFTPCHTLFQHAVNYTSATRSKKVSTAQDDAVFATWAGSGRTILGTTAQNEVRYHDLSTATSKIWFDDCLDYQDGCQDTSLLHFAPTVSRQGDRYASVLEISPWSGSPEEYLLLQPTDNAAQGTPSRPHDGCVIGPYPLDTPIPAAADHRLAMPSWSPDGHSLVVAVRDPSVGWSVYRIEVPDLSDCSTVSGVELVAGADQPFWSPADLGAAGTGGGGGTTLSYTGQRPVVAGRARVGHRVHLSMGKARLASRFSPAASRIRLSWLRDGHVITGATGRGYRLKAVDRRHRISVRVTGRRADASPGTVRTPAVRVR